MLTPSVATAIAAYSRSFRYGALSADIFIGKGCKVTVGHSHNWETAQNLLRQASNLQLSAYTYGYISHLAADTVAHNFYVPTSMLGTHGQKKDHVYAEMLADSVMPWQSKRPSLWRITKGIGDKALLASVAEQRVPFCIKKGLFLGSVALCGTRPWRQALRVADKMLPLHSHVDTEYLNSMLNASLRAIVDVLNNPERSLVLDFDPIGANNLAAVEAYEHQKKVLKAVHAQNTFAELPLTPQSLRNAITQPNTFSEADMARWNEAEKMREAQKHLVTDAKGAARAASLNNLASQETACRTALSACPPAFSPTFPLDKRLASLCLPDETLEQDKATGRIIHLRRENNEQNGHEHA